MIFGFQTYEKSPLLEVWVNEINKKFEDTDIGKNPFPNSKVIMLDEEYFIIYLVSIYPQWVEWLILWKHILFLMMKRQIKAKGFKGRLQLISKKRILELLMFYGKF